MINCVRIAILVMTVLLLPQLAAGLEPNEVLVVANSDSKESVELANHYIQARGIKKENLLLIKTSAEYDISRTEYEMTILLPIRQRLTSEPDTGIKCLCLMRGIPVRIKSVYSKDESDARLAFFRVLCEKNQYALSLNLSMLRTVGVSFPKPQTEELSPPAKLFDAVTEEPAKPLKSPQELHKVISNMLVEKTKLLQQMKEPAQLKIACRQVMAIILDCYGMNGLLAFAAANKTLEKNELDDLVTKMKAASETITKTQTCKSTLEELKTRLAAMEKINGRVATCVLAWQSANFPQLDNSVASVDSELALLLRDPYELAGPANNPLHWRMLAQKQNAAAIKTATTTSAPTTNDSGDKLAKTKIYMTARIDGPTFADATRMIDDAISVEKTGLAGTFYIDAGGKAPEYDANLRALRDAVSAAGSMKVVYDDKPTLFQNGDCPDTALYVGWYSLQKYIPAFKWNKGSIGMHVASFEAVDIHNPATEQWCAKIIQNGAAATIGAVAEPLLMAFPIPQEFFPLLMTGKLTLAECYWRTIPSASWMMILLGDPLYNPFKSAPAFNAEKLPTQMWQ